MLFICYPKCSTCAKARAWLDANGVEYEYRDIKLNNPKPEELEKWYRESGHILVPTPDSFPDSPRAVPTAASRLSQAPHRTGGLCPAPERRCSSRTFRYGYLVTT